MAIAHTLCCEQARQASLQNKSLSLSVVAMMAATLVAAGPARSQSSVEAETATATLGTPADFSAMVAEKLPAVVGILSTSAAPPEQEMRPRLPPGMEEFFGSPQPGGPRGPGPGEGSGRMQAQGSGFIISADGYVVTNNHVIAGAEKIEILFEDGRPAAAELVGTDPATDIALLKIDGASDLPFVEWGESDDVRIGEWLVAIGNPFGLGGTVTAGILSARSRDIRSGPYDDFLQTDAPINSGNSGGPLFDAEGLVIGVNTAIFSPSGGSVGIGFAVPSEVARNVVEQLREKGRVDRGWLGVQLQPLSDELAAALDLEGTDGALVAEVTPDSPASTAGLEAGDVITAVGDQQISAPRDVSFAVADLDAGTQATFHVVRDGSGQEITVEIGARPHTELAATGESPEGGEGPRLGLSLAPLDGRLREQLSLPGNVTGVVVADAETGSAGAEAGLRRGDVIVQANGEAVTSPQGLVDLVKGLDDPEEPILLRVYRDGSHFFVPVTPGTS